MTNRVINFINALNERVGRAVSWLTLVLVLWVCMDVFLRLLNPYVSWQIYKPWMMEMEWHLFAVLFLFGAGYALKHDRHVRVDLFYAIFSERDKAWINLIGSILFLIPWCLVIIYTSFYFTLDSFQNGEVSPNPGGLAYRFVIKSAILFGFSLLFLQGVALFLESVRELKMGNEK